MHNTKAILGIIDKTIQNNAAFGSLLSTEDRVFLIKQSLIRVVEPGTILCQQDQNEKALFLIIDGQVEITVDAKGESQSLGKLGSGELTGEIGALFMIPRIATVAVTRQSVVLEIPSEIFNDLISQRPQLQKAVHKRFHHRAIITSLRCVPIFKGLSDNSISDLCQHSSLLSAKKNDILVHEGKKGQGLYVMSTGLARVYVTLDGEEITLALLRSGDYFGERSLLTGEPRAASVAALTDMQAVLLEGDTFKNLAKKNDGMKHLLDLDSLIRTHQSDYLRDTPESKLEIDLLLRQIESILSPEQSIS